MLEGQQGKVELILMKMALLSLKVLECQMTLKKIKSHGEMAGMHVCNLTLYGTGGHTFIPWSFLDQILSADIFSKKFKLFWR